MESCLSSPASRPAIFSPQPPNGGGRPYSRCQSRGAICLRPHSEAAKAEEVGRCAPPSRQPVERKKRSRARRVLPGLELERCDIEGIGRHRISKTRSASAGRPYLKPKLIRPDGERPLGLPRNMEVSCFPELLRRQLAGIDHVIGQLAHGRDELSLAQNSLFNCITFAVVQERMRRRVSL